MKEGRKAAFLANAFVTAGTSHAVQVLLPYGVRDLGESDAEVVLPATLLHRDRK
jgi:hypothetical protein